MRDDVLDFGICALIEFVINLDGFVRQSTEISETDLGVW